MSAHRLLTPPPDEEGRPADRIDTALYLAVLVAAAALTAFTLAYWGAVLRVLP